MIGVLAAVTLLLSGSAVAQDLAGGNASEGHRILAKNGGSALAVRQTAVVGADGGTWATLLAGRYRWDDVLFGISLPFVTYRTPDGRDAAVGNLRAWALYDLPWGTFDQSVGLQLHFNLAGRAWTWVNAADDVWPGAGLDALWEARFGDAPEFMLRGTLGVHSAAGYEPFPGRFARFEVAGGVDYAVIERFGVVGEMSVAYWDPSPWELAVVGRVDVIEGIRARAGVVLPLAVWIGWTPLDQGAGAREATLLLDLTAAF